MIGTAAYEFWFVTGSQHLYGEETIREVEEHSKTMVRGLNNHIEGESSIVFKQVLTQPEEIQRLFLEANLDKKCAGIITWMHTFSPAKMWISGLKSLQKPLLHLHTQFNRDIPWDSIDMDFMNTNQSAHGDREYGFINSRMNIARKVVVGHWESEQVRAKLSGWMQTAAAFEESKHLKVARFGDNMREVAVTEGDKVEAQIKFGWSINGYGVGELAEYVQAVSDSEVNQLFEEYSTLYDIAEHGRKGGEKHHSILEQARIELGMRAFLEDGGFTAFTTTFEDLHGIPQLPGLAVQRLMGDGYGFAGEGDWKTAALVRVMKMMANNRDTSFMEDYTYHFEPDNELVLGSHMLEVCPSIAATKPRIEVHPLSIGGKADPARLVFDGKAGRGLNASIIDIGHRFRLVINEVDAVQPVENMPKLPVARVLWKPQPSLAQSAEQWIIAGGAHHTCYSTVLTPENLRDFAEMSGIESVLINNDTKFHAFQNELRWNDLLYR
ncbi:L-arabinose isomerase [Fictibacillus fluitans]|uniref:L-arabinose isomerase n=1 Tax=Fictibacillus fluitans TaxID=3058422 RepID=A0ABT8HV53_9BACL|nr:L-arabinose isomerase [Fictibacillus sp. NE201]MDN4524132.1 L-arabinose isomerase [Fictibacillus sp. NE201]